MPGIRWTRIILLQYTLIRAGFIMLHARFNCKATDEQSRNAWNISIVAYRPPRRGNKSRRRCTATFLLLMIFIDAALRVFFAWRYPQTGLNILVSKPSELIAVLRVSHYTSRNTALVRGVLFDEIVWNSLLFEVTRNTENVLKRGILSKYPRIISNNNGHVMSTLPNWVKRKRVNLIFNVISK